MFYCKNKFVIIIRIMLCLSFTFYFYGNSKAQTLLFNVFNQNLKETRVEYGGKFSGKFYYLDAPGESSYGSIDYSRYVERIISYSANNLSIQETIVNYADTSRKPHAQLFLFPAESDWQIIKEEETFIKSYNILANEKNAKVILKKVFGLNVVGDIKISVEEKTYTEGLPVHKKQKKTKAICLEFDSEYYFTADNMKTPLLTYTHHKIWLSADIPGGLLERMDSIVLKPADDVADEYYTMTYRQWVELIGTEEGALKEVSDKRYKSKIEPLLVEKLDHLEDLRKNYPSDYKQLKDMLIAEIADSLNTVKKDLPQLYNDLKNSYPQEIKYFEKHYLDKPSKKSSKKSSSKKGSSLIDDFESVK